MTSPRRALAVSSAAATLAVLLAVIAMGGALRAGLAPWPGIAVVAMATAAHVLPREKGSFLVAALLAASGGVIIGLPVLGLGVAKGVETARAGRR